MASLHRRLVLQLELYEHLERTFAHLDWLPTSCREPVQCYKTLATAGQCFLLVSIIAGCSDLENTGAQTSHRETSGSLAVVMAILTKLIRIAIPRNLRNALRRPSKTVWRLFAKTQFLFGQSKVTSIRPNWNVQCHPLCAPEFDVFRNDPSQNGEMSTFVAQCTPGMQLVDVGAHWGIFTLAAIRYGGHNTRAICIEASRAAISILAANLSLNNCSDRVRVVEAAAGPMSGYLDMLTTGAGGADYLVIPSEPRPDTVRIRQIAVSDVCRDYRFAPTHLKIDVEGYEEEVLLGAEECINTYRPIIFLELHAEIIRRRGRDPKRVVGTLKRLGYARFLQNSRPVSAAQLENSDGDARLLCYPAN